MKKGKKRSHKRHAARGVTVVAVNPSSPKKRHHKHRKANPGKKRAHKRHASGSRVVVVNPTHRRRRHTRRNPGTMTEFGQAAVGGLVQSVAEYGIDQLAISDTMQTVAAVAAGGAIAAAASYAKVPAAAHGATGAAVRGLFDRLRLMMAKKPASSTQQTAAGASNVLNQAGQASTTNASTTAGTSQPLQGVIVRQLPQGQRVSLTDIARRSVR